MDRVFEDNLDLIYDTAVDPALWFDVGQLIAQDLNAQAFWILKPTTGGVQIPIVEGVPSEILKQYGEHFFKVDLLTDAVIRYPDQFATRPVRERDLVGERAWLASELFNDLARPHGISQILAASIGSLSAPDSTAISFFRKMGADLFSDETVQRYGQYLPHLRRAIHLNQRLERSSLEMPFWTVDLLDDLPAAVICLDRQSCVVHTNIRAKTALDQAQGIILRSRRIVALEPDVNSRLDHAIRQLNEGKVRTTELLIPYEGGTWHLSAFRMSDLRLEMVRDAGVYAWIWMTDLNDTSDGLGSKLEHFFRLTGSEQRVAIALSGGMTTAQVAEGHQVSVATVRTQIQAIFNKLGITRQGELVVLLNRLNFSPQRRSRK